MSLFGKLVGKSDGYRGDPRLAMMTRRLDTATRDMKDLYNTIGIYAQSVCVASKNGARMGMFLTRLVNQTLVGGLGDNEQTTGGDGGDSGDGEDATFIADTLRAQHQAAHDRFYVAVTNDVLTPIRAWLVRAYKTHDMIRNNEKAAAAVAHLSQTLMSQKETRSKRLLSGKQITPQAKHDIQQNTIKLNKYTDALNRMRVGLERTVNDTLMHKRSLARRSVALVMQLHVDDGAQRAKAFADAFTTPATQYLRQAERERPALVVATPKQQKPRPSTVTTSLSSSSSPAQSSGTQQQQQQQQQQDKALPQKRQSAFMSGLRAVADKAKQHQSNKAAGKAAAAAPDLLTFGDDVDVEMRPTSPTEAMLTDDPFGLGTAPAGGGGGGGGDGGETDVFAASSGGGGDAGGGTSWSGDISQDLSTLFADDMDLLNAGSAALDARLAAQVSAAEREEQEARGADGKSGGEDKPSSSDVADVFLTGGALSASSPPTKGGAFDTLDTGKVGVGVSMRSGAGSSSSSSSSSNGGGGGDLFDSFAGLGLGDGSGAVASTSTKPTSPRPGGPGSSGAANDNKMFGDLVSFNM